MRRKRGCVDYRLVASHNDTVKVESHHFNTLSVLKSLIVLCNISKKSSSSPPPRFSITGILVWNFKD